MKKDLVSIIMPTYNRGYIISLAIDSILNQTYKNFEFIIVDDYSNDDTDKVVNSYNDKRIKYIKLDKKMGSNYARNVGLANSTGKYITFQDSDDYSISDRIEKELKILKLEDADLVFSSFYKTSAGNESKILSGDYEKVKAKLFPSKKIDSNEIANLLLYRNLITTQVLFGKKEVFEKEKFDNDLTRFQDWDLMIRISRNFKVFHIDEPLLYMFVQNDSITKSFKRGYESLRIIYNKYENIFNSEQKCRILFRIGTFKMMENIDATGDFKEGLKYYKNLEYCLIYLLYKLRLYKFFYKIIKL